jgi:type IV pilus assembly protein PilY1
LSEIESGGNRYAVVTVGTGKYLGDSDRNDQTQQSIYAIKDKLASTGYGRLRLDDTFVQQTLTTNEAGTKREASNNAVNWTTNSGWYVDLNPNNGSPGERINVDMQQQLGVLAAAGNVPENNACTVGGYAWLYFFDFRTGSFIDATGMVGQRLTGNSLVAGLRILKLDNGKTVTLITDTSGKSTPQSNPESGSGGETARRISWQELIVD